jgi:hypothetical protein
LLATVGSWIGTGLEQTFRGRNKFQHFRGWLQKEWAGLVRETVLEEGRDALRPWFDMTSVERMIEGHLAGRANYTSEIDKLLTVALTAKHLLTARGLQCN